VSAEEPGPVPATGPTPPPTPGREPPLVDGPWLIVAVGRDGAIGRAGGLPWDVPEDMARFRRVTDGHTLVVGRRTWESIGRPLPRRRLVVVSTSPLVDLPAGVAWAPSPTAALDEARATDPAPAVAGGAALYRALLDQVVRIDRTRIDVAVPDADTWFPPLDATAWHLVASRAGDDPRLTFDVLDRRHHDEADGLRP